MPLPRHDSDYLLSPDWAENGRRFSIRYYFENQEPQVVLAGENGKLEVIPLSEAVRRGMVSTKTAAHARAVNQIVRKAVAMRAKVF
jgi:hypothetical protein